MKDAWLELVARCEAAGVDAFEINFSCPHGMPERRMGMAMGQDCELLQASKEEWAAGGGAWGGGWVERPLGRAPAVPVPCRARAPRTLPFRPARTPLPTSPSPCFRHCQEVSGWVAGAATVPVWAKLTPNVADVGVFARGALTAGLAGVAAINTVTSIAGVDLDTLEPQASARA